MIVGVFLFPTSASTFCLLFLLFVIQVFDFAIALHCSGRIQIIGVSLISIAASHSYYIRIFHYINRTVWYIIMPW